MIHEKQVLESLDGVLVPGVMRSIVLLNLVRQVKISGGDIEVTLASTGLHREVLDWIEDKTQSVISRLPEVNKATVIIVEATPSDLNEVGHILAVMSGKGGVGKSTVSGLIAVGLRRRGYEVGILDADITGSSIPRMFGLNVRPTGTETGILPVLSTTGIEVIAINLLLPGEDQAVIWRGPLVSQTITQFWQNVVWGKLDYLVLDMPPGTGDASLTVLTTIPISGIIIVSTPQDLAAMIVRKAVNMAKKMDRKILGVVENMSYLYVPEIDRRIELFGRSKGEKMAIASGAPLLGQLPVDPVLARLCDEGKIERYDSDVFQDLTENLTRSLPRAGTQPS